MGTSKSSGGSPSGTKMVPPWTPDPTAASPGSQDGGNDGGDGNAGANGPPQTPPAPNAAAPSVPIAPAGRFGAARRSLGNFARSGVSADMRRGLGHYTKTGLGGSRTAVRRMGGTVQTAQSLYNSLSNLASGVPAANGQLDPGILQGRSASEVATAIVEAVRPVDGTQDAEASRDAIQDALSQLLNDFPNADLLNLSDDERWFVVEQFLATDIYNRIQLDVGKTIQDKAPTSTVALQRLAEVKDYVKQTVSAKLRGLSSKGTQITSKGVGDIIRVTIRETFEVFEGWAE